MEAKWPRRYGAKPLLASSSLIAGRLTTGWPLYDGSYVGLTSYVTSKPLSTGGGASHRLGEGLLSQTDLMFQWWPQVRDGTLSRTTFQEQMSAVQQKVGALLRQGTDCDDHRTAGTCRDILKREEALWTFVRLEGVEPTNNLGERQIRPSVLWRNRSFGTQSESGSRFAERIMTVVATCKQQGRNALDYLTAACQAANRGQQAPSLLPEKIVIGGE